MGKTPSTNTQLTRLPPIHDIHIHTPGNAKLRRPKHPPPRTNTSGAPEGHFKHGPRTNPPISSWGRHLPSTITITQLTQPQTSDATETKTQTDTHTKIDLQTLRCTAECAT
eukprot:scaffold4425_cov161-Isochrysis_galbana.AAC.2